MNSNNVIRWGWRILLVTVVVVSIATVNHPRSGQASGPLTDIAKRDTARNRLQDQDADSERSGPPRARPTSSVRSQAGARPSPATATGTAAEAGTALCAQTANCQTRDSGDGKISNRADFRVADDFRPSDSGIITEACWWGTYGDDTSGSLVDCYTANVVDVFEITYCDDAGGFPGTTCTTFSQALRTLTVTGPTATGGLISGSLTEFAYSATHAAYSVTAGDCYWIEITNNSGTCTWIWEVSSQGDEWAILDGNGIDPPDGFSLDEFVLLDFAFCVDAGLDAASPCGPPSNASCPNLAQDCCEGDPVAPPVEFGCEDELCCRRVCACDPFCCDPATGFWDVFCAGQGTIDPQTDLPTGCGAAILCAQDCSPCGGPDTGYCCADNGSPSCSNATCCEAVCAVDPLCCDPSVGWDQICADLAETNCPEVCSNCGDPQSGDCCTATPSVPGCSDSTCCDAVCSANPLCCDPSGEWDAACVAEAETLCGELCAPPTCGNPETEDCCTPNPFVVGCLDVACCGAVCACDPLCCLPSPGWDTFCATTGSGTTGCGAELLCPDLCLCGLLCGDLDGSGSSVNGPASNADLHDYALFANCFGLTPNSTNQCLCADLNGDDLIDEVDFALLVALFETSSLNGPPDCTQP